MKNHPFSLASFLSLGIGTFGLAGIGGASALEDALNAMPPNSWQKINRNQFQDVWPPAAQRPTTASPESNISAWSGAAWDSSRKRLMIWGGDIGNEEGNEVYYFDTITGLWNRGALPSQITTTNGIPHAVDGIFNAPTSGESWDNVVYLENVDRLAVIGVSREGLTFRDLSGHPTGPYFWDPAKADPGKVSGTTGSHVKPTLFPNVVGGGMWQNRDGFPDAYAALMGTTAYVNTNGRDVVYFTASYDSLWKYTVQDLNPANDAWQLIGRRTASGVDGSGSAAYDPVREILVKTLRFNSLGFWDVSERAVNPETNREIEVVPAVVSGPLPLNNLGYYGMDYDPTFEAFVLWGGDSFVWLLQPPDNLDPDGDGIKSSNLGWTLSRISPSGVGPTFPSQFFTGVYGKWQYMPAERAYIGVIDSIAGDVFVYKPPYNTSSPIVDLQSFTLSATTANGCSDLSGTVTLTAPAPVGGLEIVLSDDLASAWVPATVRVLQGALTASFSITTSPVSVSEVGSVVATRASKSRTQPLAIRPIGLATLEPFTEFRARRSVRHGHGDTGVRGGAGPCQRRSCEQRYYDCSSGRGNDYGPARTSSSDIRRNHEHRCDRHVGDDQWQCQWDHEVGGFDADGQRPTHCRTDGTGERCELRPRYAGCARRDGQ